MILLNENSKTVGRRPGLPWSKAASRRLKKPPGKAVKLRTRESLPVVASMYWYPATQTLPSSLVASLQKMIRRK
jgi:hypothetical protein